MGAECNILIRFLLGRCTQEETIEVVRWKEESNYNEHTLAYLQLALSQANDL